jgi:sugar phosphate isomerase/epimerase
MRLQLGINTCFAVKRWPRPEDWAPVVRDRLGLRLVQHSMDLVGTDAGAPPLDVQAAAVAAMAEGAGIQVHSTFTGLAAYSSNLLLAPSPADREAAAAWYRAVIGFTRSAGGRAAGGHVGCFSVPDWRDPSRRAELWQELGDVLRDLAAEAQDAGLEYLMVENLAVAR